MDNTSHLTARLLKDIENRANMKTKTNIKWQNKILKSNGQK